MSLCVVHDTSSATSELLHNRQRDVPQNYPCSGVIQAPHLINGIPHGSLGNLNPRLKRHLNRFSSAQLTITSDITQMSQNTQNIGNNRPHLSALCMQCSLTIGHLAMQYGQMCNKTHQHNSSNDTKNIAKSSK